MTNRKRFANIIPIVLVVVLAGTLGYITLVKKSAPVEQPQTNNSQNVQSTIPAPSENLEKYLDADNGFQFYYPNTWKIVQDKSGLGIAPEPNIHIQSPDFNKILHEEAEPYYELKQGAVISVYVQVFPEQKTIKDLEESHPSGDGGPAFTNQRIIKVDGKDALFHDLDLTGYGNAPGHHFELLNNNRLIIVNIAYKGLDGKKIFDKIISTFHLIK